MADRSRDGTALSERSKAIARRVRAHFELSNKTYTDVADAAGWSEQRTRRLIQGRTQLLAEDLEIFARIFGADVTDFYPERPERPERRAS